MGSHEVVVAMNKKSRHKVGEFDPKQILWIFIVFFAKFVYPRCSMYVIFTYIYHKFRPYVGKYAIH